MAQDPLTALAVAALALLRERPMHPYETYQLLLERGEDRIVKVRPGSLYHTIDRLAADGMVEVVGTERSGNRPERTTYRITASGISALRARIAEMLGTAPREYLQFPVAIAEAHNLPLPAVLDRLERRLTLLRADHDLLTETTESMTDKDLPAKYWLDVAYLSSMLGAEIDWMTTVIDAIRGGLIPWDDELVAAKNH